MLRHRVLTCSGALLIVTLIATSGISKADPTNTAYGVGAFSSPPGGTGYDNSAFGYSALLNGTNSAQNTATGASALRNNSSGCCNTATGFQALQNNTTGGSNTATGESALGINNSGKENVATGFAAMLFNTSGSYNVATGNGALYHNNSFFNAANGYFALFTNTSGIANSAVGAYSLYNNTTGGDNSATGFDALMNNTTGLDNTASGYQALYTNSTGNYNTAGGSLALFSNTTGRSNVAIGVNALHNNTTGSTNIGIGNNAGTNLTTGSNNIDIGSGGVAAESSTIRIGLAGTQTRTFVAGINGTAVTGSDVVVNGSGQLGVVVSSARYKHDIHDMGNSTDGLMKLRPVSFRYRDDLAAIKQYGLVAEEVETVYPELVVHDDHGKVQSVRYSMLTSMLLNELQKQHAELKKQKDTNQRQAAQMAEVKAQLKASRERELAMRTVIEERLLNIEHAMAVKDGNRNLAAAFSQ